MVRDTILQSDDINEKIGFQTQGASICCLQPTLLAEEKHNPCINR